MGTQGSKGTMISQRYVTRSFSSLITFLFTEKGQQPGSNSSRVLPFSYQSWLVVFATLLTAFFLRGYAFFLQTYPSGADYGQIVLQANHVLSSGHLLETMPYFQLGKTNATALPGPVLFYASVADLSGSSVMEIMPIILITAWLEISGVYLLAWRVFKRLDAAAVAALFAALSPIALDMISWAGYPNLLVLALIPFVFVTWLDYWKEPDRKHLILAVLVVTGSMSIHHVSTLWIGLSLALFSAIFLIAQPVTSLKKLLPVGIVGAIIGLPVAWRAIELSLTLSAPNVLAAGAGNRFDPTRVNWETWSRLLEPLSLVFLMGGFIYFLRLRFVEAPAKVLVACYAVVSLVFSYGWILKIDFYYTRGLFFLSIPLTFGAVGLVLFFRRVPSRVVITLLLAVFFGSSSLVRARENTRYYQALTPEVFDAMAWLNDYSQPDDVVVVGTFLGFHMANLIHHPLMMALTPDLVGNPEELEIAQDAVAVMMGLYNMDEVIDRRHVRFVVVRSGVDIPDPFRTQLAMNANPRMELVFDNSGIQIYEVVN